MKGGGARLQVGLVPSCGSAERTLCIECEMIASGQAIMQPGKGCTSPDVNEYYVYRNVFTHVHQQLRAGRWPGETPMSAAVHLDSDLPSLTVRFSSLSCRHAVGNR